MKKLFTLLVSVLFLWAGSSWAAVNTYTFAGSSGTFTPIAGGTVIGTGTLDDNVFNAIDIGFPFFFNGGFYTQFSLNANGWICMGASATSSYVPISGGASNNVISAFGQDLQGQLTGEIRYQVLGATPNRTLVIQFLHWGKYSYTGTGVGDDWSWQFRLSETTGVVSIVYGPCTINTSSTTVQVGLRGASSADFNNRTTTTNWASTTAGILNTDNCTLSNTVFPANGQTFTYTPPSIPAPADPITMTFTAVTTTTMTVNWVDNSTNETGFSLIKALDAGFTTGLASINVVSTSTATTGTAYNSGAITGLVPGTTYYFKVMAVNDGGGSPGLTGSQGTTPPGNITSTGAGGLWSATTTWDGGLVPTATDNVTIADGTTVTIDVTTATCYNLTVGQGTSGILTYITTPASTLTVNVGVTIAANGDFDAGTGTLTTHALFIGGNTNSGNYIGSLTNNGTFDMNTTAGVNVTFFGIPDATISGSGTTYDFYSITVNKGTSLTPVLDVTSVITMNSPAASATRLTITNGTFKLSSAASLTPYYGTQTICAATGRLWLNNASGSINVVGIGTIASAGSPTISGELRIDNGTFGYGSGNNTATFTSGTGVLRMSGGTFNMFGAISFPSAAGTQFIMSGGNINVDPQAGNLLASGTAIFTIGSLTTVTWSNGIVTIVDPHNATAGTAWSATSGGTKNITGGTVRLGDGISSSIGGAVANTNGFGFFSSMPIWNLDINNRTDLSNTRIARLSSSTASLVLNNLTIETNGYLFLGSATTASTIAIGVNVINSGTLAGCEFGGAQHIGTIYMNGSVAANISGAGAYTNLATLSVFNTSGGVTISNAMAVDRVNLFSGSLNPANLTIGTALSIPIIQIGSGSTLYTPGTFTALPTFNNGSGPSTYLYALASVAMTTGTFNELPAGNPFTLTQLYNSNTLGLTLDRSFQLNNFFTVSGNIFMGANNLTLGVSAAIPGSLTWTTGLLVTSGGTFTRWYPTAALPTAPTSTVAPAYGYYPMGVSLGGTVMNRQVQLYFTSATGLTTGGTITVGATEVTGLTTGLLVPDGAYTITQRTNSNWNISNAGLVETAPAGILARIQGTGALSTTIAGLPNLRLMQAAAVVGTHSAGTGTTTDPQVNRTALSVADLSNTYYIGSAAGDMNNIIYSAATGDWNQTTTWLGGVVPTSTDGVVILNTHVVSVTDAEGASTVAISSGGTLNVNAGGNLAVAGASTTGITNNAGAVFNVNGGIVTLGPAGGGNRTFSNSGSLTVSSGTLNINGNFINTSSAGNVFTQSGGNINVDGNAAGVAANSVASGTNLVTFTLGTPTTVLLTGGTFTIVDPHASSTTTYALSGGMSTATNCGLGHTFAFGNGVSTDPAPAGFYVYLFPGSSYLILGNVTVNGSPGMDRFVTFTSTVGILGNVTVNSGGDFRVGTGSNYFAGNITANSGGIFTNPNFVTLSSYANAVLAPVTVPQTISGAGTFRNLLPTATVSAGGAGYVVGDILTVVGGTFTSVARFVVSSVTTGAVTAVTAIGYANYSVAPANPASTTGGTGTGCTLTVSGLTPTASMYSLSVNNNNASGVTIGTPLSLSNSITLVLGLINTTSTNLLTLGTATLAASLSGGSTTAYIVGPFARTFSASRTAVGTYSTTTLYPVGKGTSYLPLYIDPTTTAGGAVIMKGEAFTTNSGTGAAGVTNLSADRWEALFVSGLPNFTNTYLMVGDPIIVTGNQILQASSAAGVYGAVPVSSIFTAGTPNTLKTGSPILAAAYNGYFAYGNLTPCATPAAQPTLFVVSFKTTTGFIGSFTAASPAPDDYLVVRYPGGSVVTNPVDYTLYTVGGALGLGTVVSVSNATTFTETTLVAGSTYDYYVYSYNNTGCYGPVYLTVSPLTGSVTTCATAVGVPGTPASSLVTTTGFTATWTASSTPGVNYLLDVATDAGFTSFVPGYNGLDVGLGTLTWPISGLSPATTYYVRVRAGDYSVFCYSGYSGTLIQATACNPISSFPWNEGFEGLGANVGSKILPVCWSYQNVSGTSGPYSSNTTGTYYGPNTGTNFIYTYYANTTWVFTPPMSLTAGTPYDFSFYMMNKVVTSPIDFLMDVAWGSSNTSAGMTNVLATGIVCSNSTYVKFTYTINPSATGTYYFGVKTTSATSTPWYISLDDFKLDYTPTTPAINVAPGSLAFGYVPSGGTSIEKTYSLSGQFLVPAAGNITVTPPPNFQVSLTTGGPYSSSPITVGYTGGTLAATTIYSVFKPTAPSTYYTGNITNAGGGAVTQNVAVTGNSDLFANYCTSMASSTADEEIFSVTVNGATNAYDCFTVAPGPGSILNRYSNFYPLGSLTSIKQGNTISFTVLENECDGPTYYSNGCAIWIDFNQNGVFTDPGEQVYTEATTTVSPRTITGSFVVPVGAMVGLTAMRVTVAEGYYGATLTPCLAYGYGETEDYQVTVTQGDFGTLQGYVYEQPACSTPIVGATVSNGTYTTTTDGTGFYQFASLPIGTYSFTASMTGYINQTIPGIPVTLNGTTNQNFCLNFYYAPPVALQAVVNGPQLNNVQLTWLPPGTLPDQWIFWDDGTNTNSIGTGGAVDFSVASRWPVADIAPYGGMFLTKISFFPAVVSTSCTYTIKVWTGTTPPTQVYSYTLPAASVTAGVWNTYTFPAGTGVPITGSQEFWFGYEANTTTGYPAGVDNGPQIAGKGNMTLWGGVWQELTALNATLTFNWTIHGWVSSTSGPQPLVPIIQNTEGNSAQNPIKNTGMLISATSQEPNQGQTSSDQPPAGIKSPDELTPPGGNVLAPLLLPSLTGYNVYRNSVEIADNYPGSPYNDLALSKGGYDYQLSAKYDNGAESAKIGPVHVDIYTCFPPTNLQIPASTTSKTTAEVSWTASTITPNPEWIFEYGPAGFAHGTGIGGPQYIDQPFINLNSLTPGTEYDFYVRTFCTVGDSSIWVKKTFRTHYFDCPGGATAESETCGSDVNGGCNMTVPAFEPLTCGETVCGTGYFNGSTRDTDWFLFTLTQTADVTWTGTFEFSSLIGLFPSGCPAGSFIVSATGVPGATVSVTTRLVAGSYYAWAGPQFSEIVACDSLDKYYATLTCNTCLSPTALTATNVTGTTADLGWTPGGTETSWEYVIGLSPLPVPTGAGTPTNVNPTPVTGLSGSSTYCYYVRTSCGGGNFGTWAGPYCFSTACNAFTLPFAESFDGVVFAPTCWANVNTVIVTLPGTWDRQTAGTNPTCSPHSGAGMARYDGWDYSNGTTGILVTPQITIPSDQYEVRFWMYRDDGYPTNAELVNVYYNTSPNTAGATLLGTVNRYYLSSPAEATANQWYQYGFNLPAGTSGNAYLVFEGVSQFGNSIFLDDVSLFAIVPTTKTLNLKAYLEGLYDIPTGLMRQALNIAPTPEFGPGIADQVTVELHDALTPFGIAYSYPNVDLNTNGTLSITTIPGIVTGSYYVVIKHRNSIETWSMAPVSFAGPGPISYDFTTAASQAYGNNMKLMGTVYTIYGGDASQDGFVDGTDMALIDNASTAILVGYNPEDINGDGIVDGTDMALIDNNSTAIVQVQKP